MSAYAAAGAAYSRLTLLADPTDVGDEKHKAGPIAILVIVILCVACFLLFRSMSKHLRRVRDDFPAGDEPRDTTSAGTTSAGTTSAGTPPAGPSPSNATETATTPATGDTRRSAGD